MTMRMPFGLRAKKEAEQEENEDGEEWGAGVGGGRSERYGIFAFTLQGEPERRQRTRQTAAATKEESAKAGKDDQRRRGNRRIATDDVRATTCAVATSELFLRRLHFSLHMRPGRWFCALLLAAVVVATPVITRPDAPLATCGVPLLRVPLGTSPTGYFTLEVSLGVNASTQRARVIIK